MNTEKTYKLIELAALLPDGSMKRHEYIQINDIEAIDKWRCQFNDTDIFYSICIYSLPEDLNNFICPIFFDIDCVENLPATRESALILCEMLMDRLSISSDCIEIFFSGYKGFHVILPTVVFEAFNSPYTLTLNKRMAEKAEDAGARFIDKGIYTTKRIFRFPNSKNSKSGLFKIPLSFEELRDMDMNRILKLAENPRPENSLASPSLCEKAVNWYRDAIECIKRISQNLNSAEKNTNNKFKDGWRIPPCVKNIQDNILPDGIRHQTYIALAKFYRWIGMHPDEVAEQIEKINSRNTIKNPDDILRIVHWSIDHGGFPGCDNPTLQQYCDKENCFYEKLRKK